MQMQHRSSSIDDYVINQHPSKTQKKKHVNGD
jgi:hypothetical protein